MQGGLDCTIFSSPLFPFNPIQREAADAGWNQEQRQRVCCACTGEPLLSEGCGRGRQGKEAERGLFRLPEFWQTRWSGLSVSCHFWKTNKKWVYVIYQLYTQVNLKNHFHDFLLLEKNKKKTIIALKKSNRNSYLKLFANFVTEIITKKNETKEKAITVMSRVSMVMSIAWEIQLQQTENILAATDQTQWTAKWASSIPASYLQILVGLDKRYLLFFKIVNTLEVD